MKSGSYIQNSSDAAPIDSGGNEAPCSDDRLVRLMAAYQRADSDSVLQLVGCLSPRLLRFFEQQVRERPLAEDLLQDCWIRIHRSRHTYRVERPLLPWVYAIARRTAVDGYRRRKKSLAFEREFLDGNPEPAEALSGVSPETKISLWREISALTMKERQAFELLKVEGRSLDDVAAVTGVSANAVKQRVHRAYLKLRKALGDSR